jgi:hypothetical protein
MGGEPEESVFVVHGPYSLPAVVAGGQRPARQEIESFWQGMDDADLPKRSGFFIVAARKGLETTPWYVGHARRSFSSDCFSRKTLKALGDLPGQRRKRLLVYLFSGPVLGPPLDRRQQRVMETYLVDLAWHANPHLLNTTGLGSRPWRIRGLAGSRSSASIAATGVRSMLGLRR